VNDRRGFPDTIFRMKCLSNDGNTEFCLMSRLDLRKVFTSISTAKIHVLNYLMDDSLSGSKTLVVFQSTHRKWTVLRSRLLRNSAGRSADRPRVKCCRNTSRVRASVDCEQKRQSFSEKVY